MIDAPNVTPQRRLAAVLRRQQQRDQGVARVQLGKVVAAPDSKHVTVAIGGANVTVPRLASYTAPVANEACYLLAAGGLVIALGAVR